MPRIDGLNDQIIACALHESNVGYVLIREGYSFTSHPFAPTDIQRTLDFEPKNSVVRLHNPSPLRN